MPKTKKLVYAGITAALIILLSANAFSQGCTSQIQDAEKAMQVSVQKCTDVGTFSVGGLYNGNWEKLTFLYPRPWKGTFITVKIDDKIYSSSSTAKDAERLDEYVTGPAQAQGDRISVQWITPENVEIEEVLEVVDNSTLIYILLRNRDPQEDHSVGARIHIDTMLGDNDGAPIYVPGDGLVTTEREYEGEDLNFRYWKAYNRKDAPSIVATGLFDEKLTYPDKLVIANWKKSMLTAWDYETDEYTSVLGDSAVLIYYEPQTLKSGGIRDIVTGYGSGEPVLKKIHEITEITLSNISRNYCGGDEVMAKADVGTRTGFQGEVAIEVRNAADGEVIYSAAKETGEIREESVRSFEFRFNVPEDAEDARYDIEANLYDGAGTIVDTRTTYFTVNSSICNPEGDKKEPNWTLMMLLLAFVLFTAAALYVLSRKKEEILIEKAKKGTTVTVKVFNNSQKTLEHAVIEDRIVEGAEVHIVTLNVKRHGTRLSLDIGRMKPGEKAVLEYKIKGVNVVPKAVLRWRGGEKISD